MAASAERTVPFAASNMAGAAGSSSIVVRQITLEGGRGITEMYGLHHYYTSTLVH
jgi:hypothetical protein